MKTDSTYTDFAPEISLSIGAILTQEVGTLSHAVILPFSPQELNQNIPLCTLH